MSHALSDNGPVAEPVDEPRLDSWKQIAAYLERKVRTVQRWEKSEGLPVHRHQHASRGTVFAYRSEIDDWLKERTGRPEGTDGAPEAPAAPERALRRSRARRVLVGLAAVLVAAVVYRFTVATPEAATRSRLLVLPFTAIVGDPVEESIGRALHEHLITSLAGLDAERLAVIGRTSALRYGSIRLAPIGRVVDVDHVLEGTIRRVEGTLLVTTRLVGSAREHEVWSDTFELGAIGDVGRERTLAREVCAAVGHELLGLGALPVPAPDVDPRAFDAWQRGRYLWHKGTHDGFAASLPLFEEALSTDPAFVAAHVGRANALVMLGRYGRRPADEVFPAAEAAATRALELDPRSAEAHAVLAMVRFYYDRDFARATASFRSAPRPRTGARADASRVRALPVVPRTARRGNARRAARARARAALAARARRHGLVPLSRARLRAGGGREPAGVAARTRTVGAAQCLAACLQRLGDDEAAWSELRGFLDRNGLLAEIPGIDGDDPATALRNVRVWSRGEVERAAASGFVSAHSQVFSLCGLERDDEVLDWLETGLEQRDRVVLLTLVHPAFDRFRGKPRFDAVLDAVGFPSDPRGLIAAAER